VLLLSTTRVRTLPSSALWLLAAWEIVREPGKRRLGQRHLERSLEGGDLRFARVGLVAHRRVHRHASLDL
jgi:hypothetical protein